MQILLVCCCFLVSSSQHVHTQSKSPWPQTVPEPCGNEPAQQLLQYDPQLHVADGFLPSG